MKLLFDQNVSYRILKKLSVSYDGSSHVKIERLINASDIDIWEYAKQHQFTLVTLDSDFNDIYLLKGFPPKILWFQTGNLQTEELALILENQKSVVADFISEEKSGCMHLFKNQSSLKIIR